MDASTLNVVSAGCASLASIAGLATWVKLRRAAPTDDADAQDDQQVALWRRIVGPVAVYLRPTAAEELHQLETSLLMAGRRSREAIDRFCEERVLAVVLGMALAMLAAFGMGGFTGFMVAMGSLVLGLVGPRKVLDLKAADRREAVAAALPGAIDLLTTCVDASLSLERALARVAREIAPTSPVLAAELNVTARELEAGVPLADGLRRLSRRVGLDDLSALCGVLGQAHGLGAPIGNTLREFAASSRRARMGMLEERAGKLAAQMTLPLAACLLPAAMLIILGPAALQLVRALH
ncbi:MAG: type II secretion system F family protein [Myxococcales bacterium]|nr:type II secretion system F family protein [Myxococcales bacterium]